MTGRANGVDFSYSLLFRIEPKLNRNAAHRSAPTTHTYLIEWKNVQKVNVIVEAINANAVSQLQQSLTWLKLKMVFLLWAPATVDSHQIFIEFLNHLKAKVALILHTQIRFQTFVIKVNLYLARSHFTFSSTRNMPRKIVNVYHLNASPPVCFFHFFRSFVRFLHQWIFMWGAIYIQFPLWRRQDTTCSSLIRSTYTFMHQLFPRICFPSIIYILFLSISFGILFS